MVKKMGKLFWMFIVKPRVQNDGRIVTIEHLILVGFAEFIAIVVAKL